MVIDVKYNTVESTIFEQNGNNRLLLAAVNCDEIDGCSQEFLNRFVSH